MCQPRIRLKLPTNYAVDPATALRNGDGVFRQFPVTHRLAFRDECLQIACRHRLTLVYRAIAKRRFQQWVHSTFGSGVLINPHVIAFPLVARVVNDYLKNQAPPVLGILISDENREIIGDVEKTTRLLRGADGILKLGQVIEKAFFIESTTSLLLQLCDLCAYSARKKEEIKAGAKPKPVDQRGIEILDSIIHSGDEAFQDTMDWMISIQKERSGQGIIPGR